MYGICPIFNLAPGQETAINDTSSVVAAAFSYSKAAGEMATIVKLTRAPMIVPQFVLGIDRFKMVSEQATRKKQRNVKENYSLVHHLVYCGFYSFIYRFGT